MKELWRTVESLNNRLEWAENRISEFEDTCFELIQSDKNKERRIKKNKKSLWEVWYYIKQPNIWSISISKGEEKAKSIETLFKEIIDKKFP